ncbi:MAG: ribose 5-phosphate isomerase B [Elusimicrobia bacterium]|nr:ribose 5-phosphate isomerase B [Elusimicrobiota bacterium]
MKIALASDHAGYELKIKLLKFLSQKGHEVKDLGTDSPDIPADYPDFAAKAAEEIIEKRAQRAVIICGSGVGACIAANKFKGIRAGLCHDAYSARQGVEHDDMNVLCLGSRIIGEELAKDLLSAFINARFTGEERHVKRLEKIKKIEDGGI